MIQIYCAIFIPYSKCSPKISVRGCTRSSENQGKIFPFDSMSRVSLARKKLLT